MPIFHTRKQATLGAHIVGSVSLFASLSQSLLVPPVSLPSSFCLSLLSLSLSLMASSGALVPVPVSAATVEEASSANATSAQKGAAFFARAVRYYQRNDFKDAELMLRQSVSESPGDANSHYYLANTLVKLNRHDEAKEEFKRAYNLDPYGPVSGYCRKALTVYESQTPESAQTISATDNLMRYSGKAPSSVDPEKKVLSLRTQAEREKLRHQQVAESYGRAMSSTGDGEAQRIRQNARDEIDSILHGTRYSTPWVQQAAEAHAQQVQSNADELEKIARERAKERAAEYKAVSKEKSKSLDETVSNLERQLNTKALPGTPTLRHDGTDLFVRSYSPSTAKSPYPEAHPAVARVNPAHVEDVDDDAASSSSGAAAPLQHQVKGRVLN